MESKTFQPRVPPRRRASPGAWRVPRGSERGNRAKSSAAVGRRTPGMTAEGPTGAADVAPGGRRVLLVIDSSTRRVVATRPLKPPNLNADAMLSEYMAYQQAAMTGVASGPPAEPFLLRTHGESNEAGGRYLYVELLDAPGFGPVAATEAKATSPPSRGRRRSSSQRSPDARTSSPTRSGGSSSPTRVSSMCRSSSNNRQPAVRNVRWARAL